MKLFFYMIQNDKHTSTQHRLHSISYINPYGATALHEILQEQYIPRNLAQYCACWWPGSLHH